MNKRIYPPALFLAGMLPALPAAAQRYEGMGGMWHSNFDWGHMLFGGLMMVLVLGAVIGLIALLARGLGGNDAAPSGRNREHGNSALDILDERYARGEIDQEEYQQRRQDLTR